MMNKNTKKTTPSKVTGKFTPALSRFLNKSLLILVAMAWAFILGILVGKGYKPENALPELAKIMPENQEKQPEKPQVLKAEELEYYDRLKKKTPQLTLRPAPSSQPVQRNPAPKPKTEATPKPRKESMPKKKPNQSGPKSAVQKPGSRPVSQPEQKPDTQSEQRFLFVYQTVAVRSLADAVQLEHKLKKLGLSAFIESTETGWHRVNIRFKGTEAETDQLKTKLKAQKLPDPLLKSKEPA